MPKTLIVGVTNYNVCMSLKSEKPNKKFSLDDFKASSKSIDSEKLLEMITGGLQDDCHVTSGGGGGGGRNSACAPLEAQI